MENTKYMLMPVIVVMLITLSRQRVRECFRRSGPRHAVGRKPMRKVKSEHSSCTHHGNTPLKDSCPLHAMGQSPFRHNHATTLTKAEKTVKRGRCLQVIKQNKMDDVLLSLEGPKTLACDRGRRPPMRRETQPLPRHSYRTPSSSETP